MMRIRWSQATESYEFDTGKMFGMISPFGHYYGLSGLQHRRARGGRRESLYKQGFSLCSLCSLRSPR